MEPTYVLPKRVVGTPFERIWARTPEREPGQCWLYRGRLDSNGYVAIKHGPDRTLVGHRVVYQELVGPIPDGLTIDHLCRTRNCLNPDHLEPVTLQENHRRRRLDVRGETCGRGHLFTPRPDGTRNCNECYKQYMRVYLKADRERRKAEGRHLPCLRRPRPAVGQWGGLDVRWTAGLRVPGSPDGRGADSTYEVWVGDRRVGDVETIHRRAGSDSPRWAAFVMRDGESVRLEQVEFTKRLATFLVIASAA